MSRPISVFANVIIRAYRKLGIDLQRVVHEDMRENFSAYPKRWGLKKPDQSIDHRRGAPLMGPTSRATVLLSRFHGTQTVIFQGNRLGPRPRPGELPHIDSDGFPSADGTTWVVHNIGAGPSSQTHSLVGKLRVTFDFSKAAQVNDS